MHTAPVKLTVTVPVVAFLLKDETVGMVKQSSIAAVPTVKFAIVMSDMSMSEVNEKVAVVGADENVKELLVVMPDIVFTATETVGGELS